MIGVPSASKCRPPAISARCGTTCDAGEGVRPAEGGQRPSLVEHKHAATSSPTIAPEADSTPSLHTEDVPHKAQINLGALQIGNPFD